ncbi:glycosyltransferase [Lachnospiraceae bacterium 48-21]
MKQILSVVVPVYNIEKYISQCIESIVSQTYTNLDIILVDDGSTDLSGIICDKYMEKDDRIKVIHKENGGLISARYTGLLAAKSEFVTFVDGDDWIKSDMYDEMIELMLDNRVDLISSGSIKYWDNEDYREYIDIVIKEGVYDRKQIEEKIIPKMLWCKETNGWAIEPSLCNKIFKRSILLQIYNKIKKETFYFGEDTAVMYPYILEAKNVYLLHKCYYFHRQRSRGIASPYTDKDDFFIELSNVYRFLKDIFKDYRQKEILMLQLDFFFIRWTMQRKWKYPEMVGSTFSYLFPYHRINKSSRIIMYGAGRVGQEYYEQVKQLQYCKIVLWVDKNYHNLHDDRVCDIKNIVDVEYDYILIANISMCIKESISKQLKELGVPEEKIII